MKLKYKILAVVAAAIMAFGFSACGTFTSTGSDTDGLTAYDIAVKNGFKGTEAEWLESLKGKDGDNAETVYKTLYQEACEEHGYTGTFYEFIAEYFGSSAVVPDKTVDDAANVAIPSAVKIEVAFSSRSNGLREEYAAAGSGIIIELDQTAGDAYILTNFHVIYDSGDTDGWADEIKVYVYGRELPALAVDATILGATSSYDLAVLKVADSEIFRTSHLKAAEFADSDYISAGDAIFAIGNPDGQGLSVTSGIVSVDSEYITIASPRNGATSVQYRVMRIDAPVNGGNSGGGLFDLDGKLVGVVNAKTVSEDIENMAYAIPSSLAKKVYENIKKNCDGLNNRSVIKSTIGITVGVNNSYAEYNEIYQEIFIKEEVIIKEVTLLSSAAIAGLKAGDVIVGMEHDGVSCSVDRMYKVTEFSLTLEQGDKITYTVRRDGVQKRITVTLGRGNEID